MGLIVRVRKWTAGQKHILTPGVERVGVNPGGNGTAVDRPGRRHPALDRSTAAGSSNPLPIHCCILNRGCIFREHPVCQGAMTGRCSEVAPGWIVPPDRNGGGYLLSSL